MARPTRQEQPGGRDPAPEPLALVQDFCNSVDLEGEVERLAGPGELRAWLTGHGLLGPGAAVGPAELERALAVRRLNRALGPALLQPRFDPAGGWHLDPGAGGVDGALARLAAVVVDAMGDGTWSRLKPCRNHGCRWLFYDHSTNRSGTWCTMSVCGNRRKARAYRRRHQP